MVSYDDLTDEQRRAVDATDRNVTLTAGAGTGKTTTLTARYVRTIEESIDGTRGDDPTVDDGVDGSDPNGDAPDPVLPEEILTTTFTERGASDLAEAVRAEVTERAAAGGEAFDAWRTVADELEHGYVHTVHGFCARLLREHALDVGGVEPGFETIDEDETAALQYDVVGDVLEEYEDHDATRLLARQFSRRQLRTVLIDLLGERPESRAWAERVNGWTAQEYVAFVDASLHPIDADEAAARLAAPELVAAAETLRDLVNDPPEGVGTDGAAWTRAAEAVGILEQAGVFADGDLAGDVRETVAELGQCLTTRDGQRYANSSYTGAKTHWGDHPRKADFDAAVSTLVESLEPEAFAVDVDRSVDREAFRFVRALAELTLAAMETYDERKARRNVLDFGDLIDATVDFLGRPGAETVRATLREQFAAVLIDESQDTDPRQWELVELLTTREEPFDAANVFVVGDAKQSIYRFRNADVARFREAAGRIGAATASGTAGGDADRAGRTDGRRDGQPSGATSDQLSRNFRTLPAVLKTIDELFGSIFETDGVPYEAAPQPLRAERDDPADVASVEYLAVPTDPALRARRFDGYEAFATADPDHDAELESMALAARLTQLFAAPAQVYPEEGDPNDDEGPGSETDEPPSPRDVEPSDVAILLRSRTHLPAYERALDDAGIPYSVASGVGFYESPEVTALVNLLRALVDPDDERALYGALRSPLFGLRDDALARLKGRGESLDDALRAIARRAADGAAPERGLDEAARDALADAAGLLRKWRRLAGVDGGSGPSGEPDESTAHTHDGSWTALLTRILEDTGYLASVGADERPRQAIANVEKFREQLRAWGDDGVGSLATLVDRIDRRIELGGRESEGETTAEGVQILTIHDAKGTEFPVVVVPEIGRGFNDEAALGNGQVEFETVDGEPAVGLKAPRQSDPFETTDTVARESLRERRRAEERAEEKRVLYVACTRARDRLLLCGRHESAGDAEEPTLTDLVEPDVDSPSSWRDWVQPELLGESVLGDLDEHTRHRYPCGDRGRYTVSLPTPPVASEETTPTISPPVERSSAPTPPPVTFSVSATDYATLRGAYGELRFDETTRTVSVEDVYDERTDSPETRHAERASAGSKATASQRPQSSVGGTERAVDASVFGELVHRLCELRPPESAWPDVITQTLADVDADAESTADLERRVRTHARRGIGYVDSLAESADEAVRYDELYVTARFDRGEVGGFVDHLLVTPTEYHVVDYKTGRVSPDELDADASYYENQLKAYAAALHQQGTGRSVRASLVFTDVDEVWATEWTESELDRIEARIESDIERGVPDGIVG
jgi:ATP-dependent helicase/nuclease subunit A